MPKFTARFLLAALVSVGCSQSKPEPAPAVTPTPTSTATVDPPPEDPPPVPKAYAVSELFTSEGCNSCPAAEDILGKLVAENQENVYPLAFHVDYWDYLGWKDRFASKAFTDRQRAYAKAMGRTGLYTPQLVVNGTTELPGNNEATVRKRVAAALGKEPQVGVKLTLASDDGSTVEIKYVVGSAPVGSVLNVVLAERGIVVTPTVGENKGVTLHHENVVRVLTTVPIESPPLERKEGTITLTAPSDNRRETSSIVGYVQIPSSMEIVGATVIAAKP